MILISEAQVSCQYELLTGPAQREQPQDGELAEEFGDLPIWLSRSPLAVNRCIRLVSLQFPDVANLTDHVHLMDGLGRPADHADPILKVGLLGCLALRD